MDIKVSFTTKRNRYEYNITNGPMDVTRAELNSSDFRDRYFERLYSSFNRFADTFEWEEILDYLIVVDMFEKGVKSIYLTGNLSKGEMRKVISVLKPFFEENLKELLVLLSSYTFRLEHN